GWSSERATHHVLHAVQDLAVLGQASALRGQRCDLGVQQRDAVHAADHDRSGVYLVGGVAGGPEHVYDLGGGFASGEGDQQPGRGGGGGPDPSAEGLDDCVDGVCVDGVLVGGEQGVHRVSPHLFAGGLEE